MDNLYWLFCGLGTNEGLVGASFSTIADCLALLRYYGVADPDPADFYRVRICRPKKGRIRMRRSKKRSDLDPNIEKKGRFRILKKIGSRFVIKKYMGDIKNGSDPDLYILKKCRICVRIYFFFKVGSGSVFLRKVRIRSKRIPKKVY